MFSDETPTSAAEAIRSANAMEKDRDYRGAIGSFQRVVAEHPHHTIALNNLAHCYCQLGKYVDALAEIERAVEVEPNYARYRARACTSNCIARHAGEQSRYMRN